MSMHVCVSVSVSQSQCPTFVQFLVDLGRLSRSLDDAATRLHVGPNELLFFRRQVVQEMTGLLVFLGSCEVGVFSFGEPSSLVRQTFLTTRKSR